MSSSSPSFAPSTRVSHRHNRHNQTGTQVVPQEVDIELANNKDATLAEAGHLPADQVRRVTIRGLVDCGATRLVLPKSVVKELGLQTVGKIDARYADGRTAVRELVDGVHVELLGRKGVFRAGVEANRDSALIGAIVMEDLDFLIDPVAQCLYPRDPKMIVTEIE